MILFLMKNLLILTITVYLHAGTFTEWTHDTDKTYDYIYSLDYKYLTPEIKQRYYVVIDRNAKKYTEL